MSVKRYRPSCDNSGQHGLVVSGGLHSYVDTIEYTSDGAAFDHLMNGTANNNDNMLRYATPDSNYLHCLVALDDGNLFIAGGSAEEIEPDVQLDVLDLMLREERGAAQVRTDRRNARRERKKLLKLLGFKNENRYGNKVFSNNKPNLHHYNYVTYTLIIMNLQYS